MKKLNLIFLCCSAFSIASCSTEEPFIPKDKEVNYLKFNKRTPEEALSLVKSLCGRTLSRSDNSSDFFNKQVDTKSLSVISGHSSRSKTDTLIYAINFTDDNGYVLVSANKATEPILAIIDNGSFQKEANKMNPMRCF